MPGWILKHFSIKKIKYFSSFDEFGIVFENSKSKKYFIKQQNLRNIKI